MIPQKCLLKTDILFISILFPVPKFCGYACNIYYYVIYITKNEFRSNLLRLFTFVSISSFRH
jgi:hypothetical protein